MVDRSRFQDTMPPGENDEVLFNAFDEMLQQDSDLAERRIERKLRNRTIRKALLAVAPLIGLGLYLYFTVN